MVSQAQKKQMRDYLVARLEGSGNVVVPRTGEIVSGKKTSGILVNDDSLVLLIDEFYPNNALKRVYQALHGLRRNIAFVFYKDGKTYFRNAAHGEEAGLKGVEYKATHDLSLKRYTLEEMHRMIEFRPEEIFVRGIRNRRVQYYQPASERLNEGIEHFVFDNVLFDYSHIPAEQRFGDIEKTSERLFIWDKDKRRHWDCALGLYKGLLLPMTRIEELREEEEKQRQQAPLN